MEFEKLKEIIVNIMDVDEDKITLETSFQDDLAADSLDIGGIIVGIEEEFDIEVPDEAIEKIVTVNDAVEMIQQATNAN